MDLRWTYRELIMKAKLTIKLIKTLCPQAYPYEILDNEIKGFLLRVQPSNSMTYYFTYRTVESIKKRYKIGRHGSITPAQARDIAINLSAKSHLGVDIQAEKKKVKIEAEKTKASTLKGFLDHKYEPWVKVERKRGEEALYRIKYNFKDFLDMPMSQINHWQIESWRSNKLKLARKARTINRDVAALRACLSKAVDWDVLELHPLIKLKPLKSDSSEKIRYLSKDEELNLRKALLEREIKIKQERESGNIWRMERGYPLFPKLSNQTYVDYLQPMIILSINTGLRQGELFNLGWADVNFCQAVLTVNGITAKSGKTRHIPLNSEALSILKDWHSQSESSTFVFPSREGKKFNNVRKSWVSLLKEAEINNFRWHDLRHHFASKLAMAGVDLNTIRELLGHSDLTMTLRYAHLAPEHKANAVAKLVA
jgi:integrase